MKDDTNVRLIPGAINGDKPQAAAPKALADEQRAHLELLERLRACPIPPGLDYVFDNPGHAIVRRRFPENASLADTSGEVWTYMCWNMDWEQIHVLEPIRQTMMAFIHHLLEAKTILTAFGTFRCLRAGPQ